MTDQAYFPNNRNKISEEKKLAQFKLKGRLEARETNPCYKEQELSYKCLNDNNYAEGKCDIYYENYKSCKSFWASVQKERRRQGIYPELPPYEEREKIKAEHLSKAA